MKTELIYLLDGVIKYATIAKESRDYEKQIESFKWFCDNVDGIKNENRSKVQVVEYDPKYDCYREEYSFLIDRSKRLSPFYKKHKISFKKKNKWG